MFDYLECEGFMNFINIVTCISLIVVVAHFGYTIYSDRQKLSKFKITMKSDTQSLLNNEFKVNIIIHCIRLSAKHTYLELEPTLYVSEFKRAHSKREYLIVANDPVNHVSVIRNNSRYVASIEDSGFYEELLKPKIYLWVKTYVDQEELFIPKNAVKKICKEYKKWKMRVTD